MYKLFSPRNETNSPPAAATSKVRVVVVPTAITRPPAAFAARIAATVSSVTAHHSA